MGTMRHTAARPRQQALHIAALSAAALIPAARADAAYLSHAFAVSGDPVPGVPDNFHYFSLFTPNVDLFVGPNDDVVTHIPFIDASVSPPIAEIGLFTGSTPGNFRLVSRTGIEFPGLPGVFPRLYGGPFAANSAGTIIAAADLQGPGTTADSNVALFTATNPDDLQVVIREGDPVPGAPANVLLRSVLFPSITDSGMITFLGSLFGSGTTANTNSGLYFRRPGSTTIERLAREGDPTPDVPGQIFGPSAGTVRTNPSGQMLINFSLAGAGIVPDVNDGAMWYAGTIDAPLARIMQTGNQAPGLAAGINYASAIGATLARDGRIAFGATLASSIPGQVTTANDNAIFAGHPESGTLAPVVREGDPAPVPGAPNATFTGNLNFHFATGGNLVINTELSGAPSGSDSALFVGTSSQDLEAVAVAGQRAPGTPANIRFQNPSQGTGFDRAAVNAHGQAAFLARVGTNSFTHTEALYFYDPEQGLVLVARQGGQIEVKPGEFRTITDLNVANPGNGQNHQGGTFNDNGTLVFQAIFTVEGGTRQGIFTANIPLVGDANLDKVVNFADFQSLERNFLATDATRAMGDLNGDLNVDFADFMLLYNHFGDRKGGSPVPLPPSEQAALDAFAAAHVPEPSLALVALGATFLTRRKRRHAPR
jgi:hypothetical protein